MPVAIDQARQAFEACFWESPSIITRAPGRVNIIGEHTDYNAGYVLPMALEQETVLLARPREEMTLEVFAPYFGTRATAPLVHPTRQAAHPWMDYLLGVVTMLQAGGWPVVRGAQVYIASDLPVGAGVSSSAALEMATVRLFEILGNFELPGSEAPQLCQRADNQFLGIKSGIMDQFASCFCQEGHALFLDCRDLAFEHIPVVLDGHVFLLVDTASPRRLFTSKYNERVDECAQAVRALNAATGKSGTHLRDFTLEELEAHRNALPETPCRRARHVITENERTLLACRAMREGAIDTLGELLNASDASLREDYEVTGHELDAMTAIARGLPGCLGARMTGAGFGGCTIQLVEEAQAVAHGEELLRRYQAETGLSGRILLSRPAAGASVLLGG